jgi:hypothetical protein
LTAACEIRGGAAFSTAKRRIIDIAIDRISSIKLRAVKSVKRLEAVIPLFWA